MKPVKKDTNRIAKVNSLIEHELGPVLHEFMDWQNSLITITKVETSRDMKWAKIWISIFHPAPLQSAKKIETTQVLDKKIMDFLAKNIYDIQGEVNKHFHTKIIPRISFHLDTSPRYVEHIEELVKKVHGEDN
ncbi:MAG TPA: ribosome-binding factor A [Candidatus Limnocylindria bacterium]|nr:ribosome-binding factor A [Candidatus Limnocylindria bacterium]